MSDGPALALALAVLAVTLATAVRRPRRVPEEAVALAGAVLVVLAGAISFSGALASVRELGPTVGFLAALLLIAEGCRREGLFDAIGELIAIRSGQDPRRLLALVFLFAAAVTIVLGLDATVVLLPPAVIAAATQLRTDPKGPLYACAHLANSASLLLPVSNLTNLLAFRASGLSFSHFAALMLLPTVAVIAIEWLVLSRWAPPGPPPSAPALTGTAAAPRFPLAVLGATLVGFVVSSPLGLAPVWVAVAGAVAINLGELRRSPASLPGLVRAAEPGFLVFVLGLGVIVGAASRHGLGIAVRDLLPAGGSLPDLLLIAAISAALANLVNNLPATLVLVPIAAGLGTGPVLAVLIGVNVGPNLAQVGSLATLLWQRVLRGHGVAYPPGEFVRLGLVTVPAGLTAATVALWLSLQV